MALPAKRGPRIRRASGHRDRRAALIRHDANVRTAARALGVPSGDLRKLVLADQRLIDAELEAVELRLDDAEANLCEALHCGDPRRRDAVSTFMLRNTQRASKRGYAVAAQTVVFMWVDDDSARERDGKQISVPRYGDGRGDDCIEGEVATPATMIEHAPAPAEHVVVESEPDPAPEPVEPVVVESAAVRYERAD